LPDCQLALAAFAANGRDRRRSRMAAWRFGRDHQTPRFSAACPADTALVRPPSMNNRVVDRISDEYDTAAWIDPSEQLFARRGLTPDSPSTFPAGEQHTEVESLTVLRNVKFRRARTGAILFTLLHHDQPAMNTSCGRISSLVWAYTGNTTTLPPRTMVEPSDFRTSRVRRTAVMSTGSRTTNARRVRGFVLLREERLKACNARLTG
jgi:hypothetical protein